MSLATPPGTAATDRNEPTRVGTAESDRLVFFSDGVLAIAITLLALELPVPHGHDLGQLWQGVRHDAGHYLAFLISFGVIASYWNVHHQVFQFIDRSDQRLRHLSMVWLLCVVLTPFATDLLTAGDRSRSVHVAVFSTYAVLQISAALVFRTMAEHALRADLVSDQAPAVLQRAIGRHTTGSVTGFALSVPVLLVTPYGWILWIATPALVGTLFKRFRPLTASL